MARYTYAYLLDGNITSKSDNTGITTNYVYDNAGMLTSETVSNALEQIQNTAYSYDNRGNRTGVIGTGYDEYTETYTYDLNNRLTKNEKVVYNEYDHPDDIFSTRYNYDFNGNLFSENTSAIRKSLDNPSITANVFGTGDDNWNHEVGLTIYNYNLNNQLVNVQKDGKVASYTYNPGGCRSSKTVDGVTTNHIWNGTQIVAETNSDDTVKALYVYGNRRIYNEQDNAKTYYLYDAHGDTKQLTNASGIVTWDYTYDAFGNEVDLENTIPDSTVTEPYNPFRYCGEYFDQETEFIYLRARYYSPEIGRFVSEDPIADGLNWYAYCNNAPIIFVDPSGLVIKFEDDATDEEKEQFYRAVEYLKTSKTAAKLIDKIENSETVFTVVFDYEKTGFDMKDKIHWNPYEGMVLSDEKTSTSPALALSHEMGHAAQLLDGFLDNKHASDMLDVEKNNLNNYEIPIATELGEVIRSEYSGDVSTVTVPSSTDYGTIEKKKTMGFWESLLPWNWFKPLYTYEFLQNKNEWQPEDKD